MIVDGTSVQLLVKQCAAEVPAVRQLHVPLYGAEYITSALKFTQDSISEEFSLLMRQCRSGQYGGLI